MNYHKTNETQEIYLQDSISTIDSFINILERQLKIENKIQNPTPEDIESKNELQVNINNKKATKADLEGKLNDIKNLKRAQNFELECPEEITEDCFFGPLPLRELFYSVGPLNNDNKDHCCEFFRKLFSIGISSRYTHQNYKDCLLALLQGDALSDFVSMKDEPLSNIVDFMLTVYYKKERLVDLEDKLENFQRLANEGLDSSMSRYLLLAKKVDSLYPVESRTLCKEQNKIKILFKLIQGTAKIELTKLRKTKLERGEHMSYELLFTHAISLERVYNDVPKQAISLKNHNK